MAQVRQETRRAASTRARARKRPRQGSRGRGAASRAGGPARPAADVEHMLGSTDAGGRMQPLFMQARLGNDGRAL